MDRETKNDILAVLLFLMGLIGWSFIDRRRRQKPDHLSQWRNPALHREHAKQLQSGLPVPSLMKGTIFSRN